MLQEERDAFVSKLVSDETRGEDRSALSPRFFRFAAVKQSRESDAQGHSEFIASLFRLTVQVLPAHVVAACAAHLDI